MRLPARVMTAQESPRLYHSSRRAGVRHFSPLRSCWPHERSCRRLVVSLLGGRRHHERGLTTRSRGQLMERTSGVASAARAEGSDVSGRKPKIVVIDDSEIVLEVTRGAL